MAKTIKLHVCMNGKLVGSLTQKSDRGLYFQYAQDWITEHSDFAISLRLPVREEDYSGDAVHFYFDNLLPDVKQVREKLAGTVKANSTGTFDMLEALGKDCIGALQFFPDKVDLPSTLPPIKGKALTEKEIAQLLKDLKTHPLGISEGADFRISLTGAQEKTALLKKGNQWLRPIGSTPTTHIFKPAIGKIHDGIDLTTSVENEWLCLDMCKKFGLRAADATIENFENIKVLVVERFDRKVSGKKIFRLPQEDFCQALGYPSNKKYQNEGGPGIQKICEALKSSNESLRDRKEFIKAQMIFWLLAAIDGHAKNFSIALEPGGFELCPLYDVLSAEPALKAKQLNRFDVKMGMKIGEPGHYRLKDIVGRHWLQMEKQIGVPKNFMQDIAAEILNDIPTVLNSYKKLPRGFPEEIFDVISKGALTRAKLLQQILD